MTNLEITLLVAEVVTLAALVRIYRKHMIVRHLFIRFSDWTAVKIDEMAESASREIMDLQKTTFQERGDPITDDDARGYVSGVITHAKGEWEDQVDYFQGMLKCNGISPLSVEDLDWVIRERPSGLKTIPMPRRRA